MCAFVCSEVAGKELAAELVYSFLLPEVEKQTTRERGESTMSYNYICIEMIGLRGLILHLPLYYIE